MAYDAAVASAKGTLSLGTEILDFIDQVRDRREIARKTREQELAVNVMTIMHGSFGKLLASRSTGWPGGERPKALILRDIWAPTAAMAEYLLKAEHIAVFELLLLVLQTLSSSEGTFACARHVLQSLVPEGDAYLDGRSRLLDLMIRQQNMKDGPGKYISDPIPLFTTNGHILTLLESGAAILGPAIAANQDIVLPGDRTTFEILEMLALCTGGIKVSSQAELHRLRREPQYSWYLDPVVSALPNIDSVVQEGPCSQRMSLGSVGQMLEGALCCFCTDCCTTLRGVAMGSVNDRVFQDYNGHPIINSSNESAVLDEIAETLRQDNLRQLGNTESLIAYEELIGISGQEEDFILLQQHNLRALRLSKLAPRADLTGPDLRWERTNAPGGEILRSCCIWAVPTLYNNVALCSSVRGCTSYRVVKQGVAETIVENFATLARNGDIHAMAAMATTLLAQTQLYLGYILGKCRSLPTLRNFPLGLADCCSIKHDPRYVWKSSTECSDGNEILLCSFSTHDEQIPHPISFCMAGIQSKQPHPDLLYYDQSHTGIPFNVDHSWIRDSRLGVMTSTAYIKSVFRVADLSSRWSALKRYLEDEATGRNLRKWAGQWLEDAGPVTATHRSKPNGQILPDNLFFNGFYQVRAMDEVVISASVVCNTASEVSMLLSRRHPDPRITPQRPLLDHRFWTGQFRTTHILLGIPSLSDRQTQDWDRLFQDLYPDPTLRCHCERHLKRHSRDRIAYPPQNAVRLILPSLGELNTQITRQLRNRLYGKTLHVAVCGNVFVGMLDAAATVWSQMPGICGNCTLKSIEFLPRQIVVEPISLN